MMKKNSKPVKLSGHEQVVEFLNNLEHPLKAGIEEIRTIIIDVSDLITEHIKWKAPSFCINNQDRVTFNLHSKEYIQLIFHCGSGVTEYAKKGPIFEDKTGLLEWVTGDRAIVKFTSISDVANKKERLIEVVNKWIEVTKDI